MQREISPFQPRRMTGKALERFDHYFIENEKKVTSAPPPFEILLDDEWSVPAPEFGLLPENPQSKIELAKGINEALKGRFDEVMHDIGLWSWITLRYADKVVRNAGGKWAPSSDVNYRLASEHELYKDSGIHQYRHRVWGPAYLYHLHGEASRALLSNDMTKLGEGFDAVMWYNVATRPVLQAIDLLFFDGEAGKVEGDFRPPARRPGEFRKGSIREFVEHVRQVGYAYSLHRVSPLKLIEGLSEQEFGPYLRNARKRLANGNLPEGMVPVETAA